MAREKATVTIDRDKLEQAKALIQVRTISETIDVARRVEGDDQLTDPHLPERIEHDRRAGARRRQAAQRHAVCLRGAALGRPARW